MALTLQRQQASRSSHSEHRSPRLSRFLIFSRPPNLRSSWMAHTQRLAFFILFLFCSPTPRLASHQQFVVPYAAAQGLLNIPSIREWNLPGFTAIDSEWDRQRQLILKFSHLAAETSAFQGAPHLEPTYCPRQLPTYENVHLAHGAWSSTLRNGLSQSATNYSLFFNHLTRPPHEPEPTADALAGTNTARSSASPQDATDTSQVGAVASQPLSDAGLRNATTGGRRNTASKRVKSSMNETPTRIPRRLTRPRTRRETPLKTSDTKATRLLLTHDYLLNPALLSDPIALLYTNDNRYLWGSSFTGVFKIDRSGRHLRLVDYLLHNPFTKRERMDRFHGAYSVLSKEDIFYTVTGRTIEAYGDSPNRPNTIEKLWVLDLWDDSNDTAPSTAAPPTSATSTTQQDQPPRSASSNSYNILKNRRRRSKAASQELDAHAMGRALCLASDGTLIVVTSHGHIAALAASKMNGMRFLQPLTPLLRDNDESPTQLEISNGITCDPEGGIYIVSNKYLHKVAWDGNRIHPKWVLDYASVGNPRGIGSVFEIDLTRLGSGSGSTPALMVDPDTQEAYVIITDASPVFNVIVVHANTGLVAAHHPANFGDLATEKTLSEQSVLVMGNRMAVVNNAPRSQFLRSIVDTLKSNLPEGLQLTLNSLPAFLGDSSRGVQQFEFDFATKSLRVSWVNRDVMIPNSIPSVSCADGLMYGIGKRWIIENDLRDNATEHIPLMSRAEEPGPFQGVWTLEGIDWWTGKSVVHYTIGSLLLHNSLYAATEIGPGEIVSGTLGGVLRIRLRDHPIASAAS